jgi:hypothetical protein
MASPSVSSLASAIALVFGCGAAQAASVLVTPTGSSTADASVSSVLSAAGHTVTFASQQWHQFDGSQDLGGFDAVLLLSNYNWASGSDMPDAGETALRDFVQSGGGLVTGEWLLWRTVSNPSSFSVLKSALPVTTTGAFRGGSTATYTESTPDPVVNAGLPDSFTFNLSNISGSETLLAAKAGATTFYGSSYGTGAVGLAGWQFGNGRVASFSTLIGINELNDANYARLLSNTLDYVAAIPEPSTYALWLAGLAGLGVWARRQRRVG